MRVKKCYVLLCAYDGGAFSGFQRHPPSPTVQGALEDALEALGWKARIEGAGRTDAGVHACRQVVAFRSREEIPMEELPGLLSSRLPVGLEVLSSALVPESFHPRFSATSKVYRYRITTGADPSEWARRFTWTLPDLRGFPTVEHQEVSLDLGAMEEVLTGCTGRHDFSLLIHPRAQGKPWRVIDHAEVARRVWGDMNLYEFTFTASGFLRHQIRNIVGVAATAGLGLLPEGERLRLISAKGERWRGARAPGRGLTLLDVGYAQGEEPFPRP